MLKIIIIFFTLFIVVPAITTSFYGQYRDPFAQKSKKGKEPKVKKVKHKIVKEKRLNKNDDPFVSKKTGTPYNKKYDKAKKKKKAGSPGKKKKLINRNKKRAVKYIRV